MVIAFVPAAPMRAIPLPPPTANPFRPPVTPPAPGPVGPAPIGPMVPPVPPGPEQIQPATPAGGNPDLFRPLVPNPIGFPQGNPGQDLLDEVERYRQRRDNPSAFPPPLGPDPGANPEPGNAPPGQAPESYRNPDGTNGKGQPQRRSEPNPPFAPPRTYGVPGELYDVTLARRSDSTNDQPVRTAQGPFYIFQEQVQTPNGLSYFAALWDPSGDRGGGYSGIFTNPPSLTIVRAVPRNTALATISEPPTSPQPLPEFPPEPLRYFVPPAVPAPRTEPPPYNDPQPFRRPTRPAPVPTSPPREPETEPPSPDAPPKDPERKVPAPVVPSPSPGTPATPGPSPSPGTNPTSPPSPSKPPGVPDVDPAEPSPDYIPPVPGVPGYPGEVPAPSPSKPGPTSPPSPAPTTTPDPAPGQAPVPSPSRFPAPLPPTGPDVVPLPPGRYDPNGRKFPFPPVFPPGPTPPTPPAPDCCAIAAIDTSTERILKRIDDAQKSIEECACPVESKTIDLAPIQNLSSGTLQLPTGCISVRMKLVSEDLNIRSEYGGGNAPDVKYVGWYSLSKTDGVGGDRKPISYGDQEVDVDPLHRYITFTCKQSNRIDVYFKKRVSLDHVGDLTPLSAVPPSELLFKKSHS